MIRKYKPEVVLCNAVSDRHIDHSTASKLVSDSCFLSGLSKLKVNSENGNLTSDWRPSKVYHYIQWDDIHPDFVLRFDDGRIVYWEHLGRVLSKSYMRGWDSRKELYEESNDFKNVITTDELSGIDDDKIDTIIAMLVENKLTTEDSSNRYFATCH